MIRPPQNGPAASATTEASTTTRALATALTSSAIQNAIRSIRLPRHAVQACPAGPAKAGIHDFLPECAKAAQLNGGADRVTARADRGPDFRIGGQAVARHDVSIVDDAC